ncbi:two-component sensor histidine kinase [Adhaeribacter aerolatus]|uniref:histidine kinase n=1 Tax=Adhaeribacter aerolatus TaxID=670289 RepID=A0A512B2X3_9BACT|nr:HAMP domain-containing sensor histidine kinase [Adhaeribacter aerolatus]GEO06316.1 two-component sensor histidine kinase [Adhaeribacter aerolatus]
MKIRTRLTLQFTSIFAIILVLFSLTVYFYTAITRSISFYDSLANRANIVAHVFLDADKVSEATYRRILQKYYQTLPYEIVQVYNLQGKVVFREGEGTFNLSPVIFDKIKQNRLQEWKEGRRHFTGLVYKDVSGEYVVVASSIDVITLEKLGDLRLILVTCFLGSMLVVFVGGWFFAKQALRPILKVVQEVEKINASDLHLRLSQADGKDEVSHLALTFNYMLDRLESAFDMQNTFISNASHELRTPLTAIIGELEVALMKPRESYEYKQVLQSVLDEARLLARLSNGMLQIAHASFDISKIKLEPLRFDELVFQAIEEAKKRQPHALIDINFENLPDDERRLNCRGNESLLLIALLNIIENACKFSGRGQSIKGSISAHRNFVQLQIKDEGRGMSPDDLKKVFVPFWRADNVRDISGHGIGLPLAERIVKLHKGTIQINSKLGVGTEVVVTIPAAEILISF